ncbi:hypothetical protein B5E64_05500 [Drancourtella sp. An12]|uniref:hypothetical protein n=1 Tax=Drancourtella sp. An12 TaxID=1965548 RepID=UPI000B3A900B|nr:hypothetical protein [Drancourtella sp. An12]OUQ46214.1 hypothetical protein B5E64_05500 [Drancourtella sp. An12]
MKPFTIWNSELNLDDWKDYLEEEKELNPSYFEGCDFEEAAWALISDLNQEYLEDERVNLNVRLEHSILVLADLGLWNGRRRGVARILSGNIKDILESMVRGTSEQCWYCDGKDICCRETHHDGTNYYTYREVRRPETIDRFVDRYLSGEEISRRTLNYYTRSIAPDVGRIYGSCRY